ncbi:MAG: hypothetical protein R3E68_01795 [Burkholderiaceae bacterium]
MPTRRRSAGGALAFGVELIVLLAIVALLWAASAPAKGDPAVADGDRLIDAGAAVEDIALDPVGAANDYVRQPGVPWATSRLERRRAGGPPVHRLRQGDSVGKPLAASAGMMPVSR